MRRRRRITVGATAAVALLALGAVPALKPSNGSRETSRRIREPACAATVGSPAALRRAVARARPGAVVCLRDGSYGRLRLDARKPGPPVTVRALHPGGATLAGADLRGANLALARFRIRGEVTIEPGSRKISILHNRISGGYFGVQAGPTTSTYVTDTTIRGNRFVGPFGEDAIRLNRFHDSADRDPYGVLVEENEITGVRENGNHSDCLQSVWGGDSLYFRRNYVHDNRCQGFFVKDQPQAVRRIVVADNLMVRNAGPCAPSAPGCGEPAIVQVFGPTAGVRIRRNTIWTADNDSPLALREGPFGPLTITDNVIHRGWSDWRGGFPDYTERRNLVCKWEGLPRLNRTSRRRCRPAFRRPRADDFRLRRGGTGVDWVPQERHFGP